MLLTAAQMQAADACALEQGIDSFLLMQSAGRAVAETVLQQVDRMLCRVLVVAGPGNNGGDGAVAAVELARYGIDVSIVRFGKPAVDQTDAGKAFKLWTGDIADIEFEASQLPASCVESITSSTIIIDALFGAGLSRALDGVLLQVVEHINSTKALVVAVDVPSGLDGNTHQPNGTCVKADITVTFFKYKPVHFLIPGRELCGRIVLAQIGLTEQQVNSKDITCWLNEPELFKTVLPSIRSTEHKYDRGHVVVRCGPADSTGAARLSASTALHCGAGLVSLASSRSALSVNASHLTAVMLAPCDNLLEWQSLMRDQRINTVVIGPANGVNTDTQEAILATLKTGKQTVLDADALSCWAVVDDLALLILALSSSKHPCVLTPHAGEFQRLFGCTAVVDAPSKLHQSLVAAKLTQSIVIYKGADTIIASPDGRSAINANAPAWLATAGSGDVLAGIVAALLSQAMPAFEAACAAVWLHAEAANTLRYPLCAEQLVTQAGKELGRISPINR